MKWLGWQVWFSAADELWYCVREPFPQLTGKNVACDVCLDVLFSTQHGRAGSDWLLRWWAPDHFLETACPSHLALLNPTFIASPWLVKDLMNVLITNPSCSRVVNYPLSLRFFGAVHLSLLWVRPVSDSQWAVNPIPTPIIFSARRLQSPASSLANTISQERRRGG